MRGGTAGRRHSTIIRELDIPRPWDLGRFVAGLEHRRGRPIRLCPFRAAPGAPCGLWIGTARTDYVYYEAAATPFHATHIVVHELAHMLSGHGHTAAWDQLASLLMPDLGRPLIQLVLGRGAYTTAEEREAETLASLILSEAS
jgi:hypothetical protein